MPVSRTPRFFFRMNKNGIPIPNSNIKRLIKPLGNWGTVLAVINGPTPITRQRFGNGKRYFVQIDNTGAVIESSLVESTSVPEGNYLELFANGYITVTDDSATNSGVIQDTPAEILDIPLTLSQDFLDNGYKTFKTK